MTASRFACLKSTGALTVNHHRLETASWCFQVFALDMGPDRRLLVACHAQQVEFKVLVTPVLPACLHPSEQAGFIGCRVMSSRTASYTYVWSMWWRTARGRACPQPPSDPDSCSTPAWMPSSASSAPSSHVRPRLFVFLAWSSAINGTLFSPCLLALCPGTCQRA